MSGRLLPQSWIRYPWTEVSIYISMDFDILFQNLYSIPAIPIPSCQGKQVFKYPTQDVIFDYNKLGYRSIEFDHIDQEFILVAGCSHTEGHGLHLKDTWAVRVADSLSLDLINLAKASSGADFAAQNIFNWISSGKIPKIIIAQWPNPFRFMQWQDQKMQFVTSGNPTSLYDSRLKNDEFGFWARWVSHIITVDQLCQKKNIPILHLCFEEETFVKHTLAILESNNVQLHTDMKKPGQTWYFDNQAADNLHHSPDCHYKWADRILTLVENRLK